MDKPAFGWYVDADIGGAEIDKEPSLKLSRKARRIFKKLCKQVDKELKKALIDLRK